MAVDCLGNRPGIKDGARARNDFADTKIFSVDETFTDGESVTGDKDRITCASENSLIAKARCCGRDSEAKSFGAVCARCE